MKLLFNRFRYRIYTTLVPRMAARQSTGGKPEPFQGTVLLDRLHGIGGTGRVKTTMLAHEWAEYRLIGLDQ
jgi:hypothetical protein